MKIFGNSKNRDDTSLVKVSGELIDGVEADFLLQMSRDPQFKIISKTEYKENWNRRRVIPIVFQMQKKLLTDEVRGKLNEWMSYPSIDADYYPDYFLIQ
jgi:hypothetical protein